MNLQSLYELKARLEQAAIAGTGLLAEDFRLSRAAEGLKPLAAASPVFAKLDAGLNALLAAPAQARAPLLLDVLALADAVVYTQAQTGGGGEWAPLPVGGGTFCQLSYGQAKPLLDALTGSGGGRMEAVRDAWEVHPESFSDFRILPAVVAGLGDSYSELAELNAEILKKLGPAPLPLLKKGFDPAGKKEMARRVEVIAALEGPAAGLWLREILPNAQKDVRIAVLTALGCNPDNAPLLLELAKAERGKNREAVLAALAMLDGAEVRAFWQAETGKNPNCVKYLRASRTDWASDLAAAVLQKQLEAIRAKGEQATPQDRLKLEGPRRACIGKTSDAMLDCWRWIDDTLNSGEQMKNAPGQIISLSGTAASWLLDSLCSAGPGPLCGLCLELWEKHWGQTRYLPHAVVAALLTRPAAEVFDEFSPFLPTAESPASVKAAGQSLHNALLQGLSRLIREEDTGAYLIGGDWPIAQPLDPRWFSLLIRARWHTAGDDGQSASYLHWERTQGLDVVLMRLVDPSDRDVCEQLIPYLRRRMEETGRPYIYSQWLFHLGGSPKGVLGRTMAKNPDANHLSILWRLLYDAAQALPPEEVIALMEELLASGGIISRARPQAKHIFPATAALLREGKPFPTWDDWLKF